jgi:hypothetical protein
VTPLRDVRSCHDRSRWRCSGGDRTRRCPAGRAAGSRNAHLTLHASGDSAEQTRRQLAEGSVTVAELLQDMKPQSNAPAPVASMSPRSSIGAPYQNHGYQAPSLPRSWCLTSHFLSPLVLALTTLSNSQLDGPWWSCVLDNPMYREVRLAAIADARRRADDYAAPSHHRGGLGRGVRFEYSDSTAYPRCARFDG